MKTLVIREDEITCKICGAQGERLSFNDGTTQVEHPKRYHDKTNQYVTPVCKEVYKTR